MSCLQSKNRTTTSLRELSHWSADIANHQRNEDSVAFASLLSTSKLLMLLWPSIRLVSTWARWIKLRLRGSYPWRGSSLKDSMKDSANYQIKAAVRPNHLIQATMRPGKDQKIWFTLLKDHKLVWSLRNSSEVISILTTTRTTTTVIYETTSSLVKSKKRTT